MADSPPQPEDRSGCSFVPFVLPGAGVVVLAVALLLPKGPGGFYTGSFRAYRRRGL